MSQPDNGDNGNDVGNGIITIVPIVREKRMSLATLPNGFHLTGQPAMGKSCNVCRKSANLPPSATRPLHGKVKSRNFAAA